MPGILGSTLGRSTAISDFDLKLTRTTEGLGTVELGGPPSLRTQPLALDLDLEAAERSAERLRTRVKDRQACMALGQDLFAAAFPPPIRAKWEISCERAATQEVVRLRLDIRDRRLAALPWEILHNGEYYLAMAPQRPVVRCIYGSPVSFEPVEDAINVMVVVADPSDVPSVPAGREEIDEIVALLSDLGQRSAVRRVEVVRPGTKTALQNALRDATFQILHFVGHGGFTEGASFLLLEDEEGRNVPVDGEELATYLRDSGIQLLFLNACHSGHVSPTDPMLGIAQSVLARARIPAVLAMQHSIVGEAAASFSGMFYRALLEGADLEHAAAEGRKAIMGRTSLDRADWAIPVLYTNADESVLVVRPDESHPVAIAPATREPLSRLPAPDYTTLLGREAVVERVLNLVVAPESPRVVEITGLGGVGRSALAREVAQRALDLAGAEPESPHRFDVVVWAAPVCDSEARGAMPQRGESCTEAIYREIMAAFGDRSLREADPAERRDRIASLLSNRRLLLVIDDADRMDKVELGTLLGALPRSAAMILTCHIPLVPGAQQIGLHGLDDRAAIALLRAEAETTGAASITDASEAHLLRLASAADRLPLVLRWAVAYAREVGTSIGAIVDLLRDSPPQLVAEECVATSTAHLDETERRVLDALASFPQPVDASLLAHASDIDDDAVAIRLRRLEQMQLALPSAAAGEYGVPGIVRRYVLGAAATTERDMSEFEGRVVAATLRRAVDAAAGGDEADRLDSQLENVMWGVELAYRSERWSDVVAFRKYLNDPLYFRGHWDESIRLGTLAMDAATRLDAPTDRAWSALYPLARIYLQRGDLDNAERHCREAISLFAQAGDIGGLAHAERDLGRVQLARSQIATSLDRASYLARAEALFDAAMLEIVGLQATLTESDREEVVAAYGRAEPSREHVLLGREADLVSSLGGVSEQRAQLDERRRPEALADARQRYERALEIYRTTRNEMGSLNMQHRLGSVALGLGQLGLAQRMLEESLRTAQAASWRNQEAKVLHTLAILAETQERFDDCREYLDRAERLFAELGSGADLARVGAIRTRVEGSVDYQAHRASKPS